MADPAMTAPPDADEGADPGAAAPDAGTDSGDQSGQVLLTVLKNDDGSYTVTAGDEDDGEAAGGAEGGADVGEKPEGQTFQDPGQVLKACLDILNKDAEASGGGTQSNFEAGFSGDNAPTPKAMPPKM